MRKIARNVAWFALKLALILAAAIVVGIVAVLLGGMPS